jgi:ribonuclease R
VAGDLRARREQRGALEVDSREPSFRFDDEGNVVGVDYEEQSESHRMIEELMVLANEQVAGYLEAGKMPTLYRVHERPDPSSVEFMIEQLTSLDVPTPPVPRNMSPQQAAELAAEASRMAAEYSRRSGRGRRAFGSLVLRSLKQAFYTPRNLGHAGLASPHYCHFTSPIRRYPDIVAHRALLQGLGIDSAAAPGRELEEVGVHSSATEREAMKIERDADDVCASFLLERELAEADPSEPPEFEGEVVSTIEKGAFVTFGEEGFEGFVPVRRMRGWWHLNELGTALEEEKSGRTLRIGDPLAVVVDRVDAPRGRVDLVPAGSYS